MNVLKIMIVIVQLIEESVTTQLEVIYVLVLKVSTRRLLTYVRISMSV